MYTLGPPRKTYFKDYLNQIYFMNNEQIQNNNT